MNDIIQNRTLIENIINNNLYDEDIIAFLITSLQSNEVTLSEVASFGLVNAPEEFRDKIAQKITPLISSNNINLRNLVGDLIIKLGNASLNYLLIELKNSDPDVRKFSCDIIGQIGFLEDFDPVYTLLYDENENVVLSAIETLGCLEDQSIVSKFIELYNESEYTQSTIIESLGRIGGEEAEAFLLNKFDEIDDEFIRTLCIEALAQFGTSKELCEKLEVILINIKDSLKGNILKAYVAISQRNDFEINTSYEFKQIAHTLLNDDDDEIKLSALVALGNNYNEEDIRTLTNLNYLTRLPIMLHVIYFNLFNYCNNDLIEKFFKEFFANILSLEGIIDTISHISYIWEDVNGYRKPFIIELIFKELFEINTSACNDVYDFFDSLDTESTSIALENLSIKGIVIQ